MTDVFSGVNLNTTKLFTKVGEAFANRSSKVIDAYVKFVENEVTCIKSSVGLVQDMLTGQYSSAGEKYIRTGESIVNMAKGFGQVVTLGALPFDDIGGSTNVDKAKLGNPKEISPKDFDPTKFDPKDIPMIN